MNFYPHHIGDFNNATRHLTRIERSVYRDMIDLYYDTEEPLTLDIKALCRKLIARTDEETTAVEQVLNEFFTETEQGWHHSRCESEISAYRASITAKSAAGKASAAKRELERKERLGKLNGCQADVQQPLDSVGSSVQLTKNQEPLTINQIKEKGLSGKPDDTAQHASSPSRFADFWKTYPSTPRKTAKSECEKRWKTRKLDSVADDIIAHVEAMKPTKQWQDGYEPAPLTYLNQKRWEDGIPINPATTGASRHGNFANQDYRAGVGADGSF